MQLELAQIILKVEPENFNDYHKVMLNPSSKTSSYANIRSLSTSLWVRQQQTISFNAHLDYFWYFHRS